MLQQRRGGTAVEQEDLSPAAPAPTAHAAARGKPIHLPAVGPVRWEQQRQKWLQATSDRRQPSAEPVIGVQVVEETLVVDHEEYACPIWLPEVVTYIVSDWLEDGESVREGWGCLYRLSSAGCSTPRHFSHTRPPTGMFSEVSDNSDIGE